MGGWGTAPALFEKLRRGPWFVSPSGYRIKMFGKTSDSSGPSAGEESRETRRRGSSAGVGTAVRSSRSNLTVGAGGAFPGFLKRYVYLGDGATAQGLNSDVVPPACCARRGTALQQDKWSSPGPVVGLFVRESLIALYRLILYSV